MAKKCVKKIRELFKNEKSNMLYFVLPSIVGVLIFVLFPLVDVFLKSFQDRRTESIVGFANYKVVIDNMAFQIAVKNTLRFELISIPLLVILSLLISVAVFNMKSNLVKFAFLIPMAIPSNSVAVIWKVLFDDVGIINHMLTEWFHMEPIEFFSGNAVFFLLVGTFVWKNLGYNMLIWLAGLAVIPKEINEAAKVDGASDFRLLIQMTIPNLRTSTFIVVVLSLVNSFKVYREAYLISGTYPDNHIYMLQHIFNNWFAKLGIENMAAGAVLTAISFFAVLLLLKKIILWERDKVKRKRRGEKKMRRKAVKGNENYS